MVSNLVNHIYRLAIHLKIVKEKIMNKKLSLVLAGITAVSSLFVFQSESKAQEQKFYCGESNGVPTTFADKLGSQDIAIIRWTKPWSEEFTPQRRCEIVSEQFQKADEQGSLNHITSGYWDGSPVVCGTSSHGGSCEIVLFTLRKEDNPIEAVNQLLGIASYASQALEQSTGIERTYYDFNQAFDLN